MNRIFFILIAVLILCSINNESQASDSSNFLQGLIDRAENGDTIIIPNGFYQITDNIVINNKTNIKIIGKNLVVLDSTAYEHDPFIIKHSHNILFKNISFRNITNTDQNSAFPTYHLINIYKSNSIEFTNCEFQCIKSLLSLIDNKEKTILKITNSIFIPGSEKGSRGGIIPPVNCYPYKLTYKNNFIFNVKNKIRLTDRNHRNISNNEYFGELSNCIVNKLNNYYSTNPYFDFYKTKEVKQITNKYLKAHSGLLNSSRKDEFEKKSEYKKRLKFIKYKIREIKKNWQIKMDNLLKEFIDKKNRETSLKNRKTLKGISLNIESLYLYDPENEIYKFKTRIGTIKCSIAPKKAKYLSNNYNQAIITGFYYTNESLNTKTYDSLTLKTGNEESYPCYINQ